MANPPSEDLRQSTPKRGSSKASFAITIAVAAVFVAAILLHLHWPFSRQAVLEDLREASDSQVTIQSFRETFFPAPGCILEGVVFRHGAAVKPLIAVDKLTVQGSYLEIPAHRVRRIVAEGLRISIPPFETSTPFHTTQLEIQADEFVANGATLEFASKDPKSSPMVFDIHEATLGEVTFAPAFRYRVKLHTPEPPGEITAEGKFGEWIRAQPGKTPISGEYVFSKADLSVFDGIAGTVDSKGEFAGTLDHIDVSGSTDVPDFEVKSAKHPMHLRTQFSASVDAVNGDVFLKNVDSDFRNTHVVASGRITAQAGGKGKVAVLHVRSDKARIEDILSMFVTDPRAPMSGATSFDGQAEIPAGPEPFLKRVKLRGDFGVSGASFSNHDTQTDVNKLSAGARGEKKSDHPETVLTGLKGYEDVANGIAEFKDVKIHIPGAAARLRGTYSLINNHIDLRGQLRVDTQISNTQTGAKALALKVIQPFFKRKPKGQIVPVRLSGTYDNPSFGLDLRNKRAQLHPLHPEGTRAHNVPQAQQQ